MAALSLLWAAVAGAATGQPANPPPLLSAEGEADGNALGAALAIAGDVDRDGTPDIITGSPRDDGVVTDSGSAWLYSGASGGVLQLLRGASSGDQFGFAVAAAGDVDADGYADVIVGAPHEANRDDRHEHLRAGCAHVISGRDGKRLWALRGPSEGAALGWSVQGVGDVDRDGHADVAAGAPFYFVKDAPDIGLVRIYSGKTGEVLHELLGVRGGDRFGWSLASVADRTGDRVPELLIGAEGSSNDQGQAGAAYVFDPRRGRRIRELRSGQTNDYHGTSVANAGDIDDDGKEDWLVGAWNGRDPDARATGMAMVFSGRSGKPLHRVFGDAEHDRFGASVTGLGDIDGDGHADFAVGAPQEQEAGRGYVRIFSGAKALPLSTLHGEAIGDLFGDAIAATGPSGESPRGLLVGSPGRRGRGGWMVYPVGATATDTDEAGRGHPSR